MAEAILGVAIEKLSSLVGKELGLFLGLYQDIEKLNSMFSAIKAKLQDAEMKQFSNEAIKNWLWKLKEVAHELDDIMDECAYEELRLGYQGIKCGLSNQVQTSCLSSFHPRHVVFRYKTVKRMKRISERLDQIAKEKEQLNLTETIPERTGDFDWRQTTSFITEPKVYGREEDKNKIIDFLVVDASQSEDLWVYPIIGQGGLGKTTLAQLVFNHERVVEHFELRLWVCVSEDFSLKRMTKAIIEAASERSCEDMDLEPLQKRLQDMLQRKRFLLVLDDVWDDEQENWQRLRSVLSCGAKGSSVLVTTRISTVAAIMGTIPSHELSVLSDKNCWELFKQRAFGSDEVIKVELEDIGKEIIKKCGGVPLAAKALGSLLRFERYEEAWLNIKENNLWSSSDKIMPALSLSYTKLPMKLRHCFGFCAIFPKDERIEKQHLIELWMANGYMSSEGKLDAEGVGHRVWHELHQRSFFQDIETNELGEVTRFKLHDLVHDLAQFVAEDICCITEYNYGNTKLGKIHHFSQHHINSEKIQLPEGKSLTTCILSHCQPEGKYYSEVLKYYSLRVLDFPYRKELPSSLGYLIHLRYLNLSGGHFETLPKWFCKLLNLQILKLDNCYKLQKFPDSFTRLKALQQLSLCNCDSLSSLPPGIGKLTSLRKLTVYIVDEKEGYRLAELGALKLKGDLHIKHLEKVKSVKDVEEANMSSKQLNELLLSWENIEESELQNDAEQILEALQPDTRQLHTLCVIGYKGAHFPQWMSSPSLQCLNRLDLKSCENCVHLPVLGKLHSLEILYIRGMDLVKYLYEESYDVGVVFMALKYLSLNQLPNLTRLSKEDGENMFPHLFALEITECPNLLGLPNLPSINYLHVGETCNQDLLSSINKLSNLNSLHIGCNDELTSFPHGMLQNLTSLQKLHFDELNNLKELPTDFFGNLVNLEYLTIISCSKLTGLTRCQGLSRLRYLRIGSCEKMNMEDLHEALQHMTALKTLGLSSLPNLESLPDCFGILPLLQRLLIINCPKLRCLPTSLTDKPPKLMDISGSPLLENNVKFTQFLR